MHPFTNFRRADISKNRLYLESDYGQRTDRENDLDTDLERAEKERERRINSRLVK